MQPSNTPGNVYEMLWKCDFCGTDKLLGKSQRFCPCCGAPQNPDSRYFPSDAERVAVQHDRYRGADRICPACGTANGAESKFCTQCGSPLQQAVQAKLKTDRSSPLPTDKPPRDGKLATSLRVIAVMLILGGGVWLLDYFWRQEITLQLTSTEWRREIKIEQLQVLKDSAWCTTIPDDAYSVSSRSEIRSYRKVADGENCTNERVDRGDGTFTMRQHCVTRYRDEPVYDRKCYFAVNRWRYKRSLTTGGTDREPYDPEVVLVNPGLCLGCERQAQRIANYFLNLTAPGGKAAPFRCETSEDLWRQATLQSQWTLKAGIVSGKIYCETLQPESSR
ncbi:MAG: zinc-ribbon domain-containing protein [Gammaproteobacteria bacterium]